MRTRRRLLWYSLATALAAVAFALAGAPVALRTTLGVPLVFLVPGYGIIEALDPAGRLRGTERVAISLGASIAVVAVTGLLLAVSPAGLGTATWSAALGWLSVVTTLLALHRTRELSVSAAAPARRRSGLAATALFVTMVGLAMLIVISGERLGSEQNVEQGDTGILQLWATPTASGELTVGFENPAEETLPCRLRVRQGPAIAAEQELLLPPGTDSLTITPPVGGSRLFPVQVELLDEDGAQVLRSVSVWLPVVDTGRTDATGAKG